MSLKKTMYCDYVPLACIIFICLSSVLTAFGADEKYGTGRKIFFVAKRQRTFLSFNKILVLKTKFKMQYY